MKLSELKSIIREEIQKELLYTDIKKSTTLHENIIADIIALILTPKVKKDAKKLKNTPEWKELEQQVKKTTQELDKYNAQLERKIKKWKEMEAQAKKEGRPWSKSLDYYLNL